MPFGVELPENFDAPKDAESPKGGDAPAGAANDAAAPAPAGKETARTEPQASDLDSLDRVRFRGKEFSKEELENLLLGQEQRQETDNKKFDENFAYDLAAVMKDPSKLAQFAQIYPATYVDRAKFILEQNGTSAKAASQTNGQSEPKPGDPRFDEMWSTVQEWKQHQKESRIQNYTQQVDSTFEKLSAKYAEADQEVINSRLQAILAQGANIMDSKGNLDSKVVEKLFKQDHDARTARYEAIYRKKVDAQKTASTNARDMGRGGAPASTAGSSPRTIRGATENFMRDIEASK